MARKPITVPDSIVRQLNFAASAGNAVGTRLLEPHRLTLAQWAVLSCLWHNGALGVGEIARLTGNTPPAVSRIVDRMIAAGLLLRRQDPEDRRAVTVSLSPRAEALRGLQTLHEDINAILLADLSDAEQETLLALLARIERRGRDWLTDTS